MEKFEFEKEILKHNEVGETLFVGVGGIGSDIILKVANKCTPEEKTNIRFVAMDTDANELRAKAKNGNIVTVQTSSTQSVFDYLRSDKAAREEWFPVNTTLYGKTVSEGAGQVRAISRLALNATIKSGNINALYNAIDDLFLKDGGGLKQALRVVIVSSVAGGTGSGIAMTVGMLIREYLHEHYREKAAIIRGYLLLPGVCDTFTSAEAERASLRRNGYATIKEINAFMMKASGFCDVRKDLERFKDLYVEVPTSSGEYKRLEGLPFDFCFLLDRLDKAQTNMSTLDQYKEFAAQSLFEQNVGPMRTASNSMEDNVIKEFANGDNLGRNRFGGIGASVIRYPYESIMNYVAYSQAISRIGCSQDSNGKDDGVDGWLKYDREFKKAVAEYKKNRAFTSDEAPQISKIYVDTINNGDDRFDRDVKSYISQDMSSSTSFQTGVDKKIDRFLDAFKADIRNAFMSRPTVAESTRALKKFSAFSWEDYKGAQGVLLSDKGIIDEFIREVDRNAANIAKERARSILFNAPSAKADIKDCHLESLFKTKSGAMHPNAIRYLLYALSNRLNSQERSSRRDSIVFYSDKLDETKNTIQKYGDDYRPDSNEESDFDAEGKFSKEHEKTLRKLCETVDNVINGKKLPENDSDFRKLIEKAEECTQGFYDDTIKYRDCRLFKTAYEELRNYVNSLSEQFEQFFNSFEEKAYSLKKKKTEIVDSLRFHKGDSIINICSTKEELDKIYDLCDGDSAELLLPDELNADIFDAVKKNAEIERLRAFDPRNAGIKEDIFDGVLIDYFKSFVQNTYDEIINLNIIQAIKMQQNIDNELSKEPKLLDQSDINEYLAATIRRGTVLASPGIGFGSFDADRMIMLCAYNKSLDKMLDINVKNFVDGCPLNSGKLRSLSSDSVSKFEMRFFSALYNITPDGLSRFRNPQDCDPELNTFEEGIYYTAYHEYSQKIGPDSTKSGTISSHIDKRWDAITELPEISMNAQYAEMVRIHSSLIYGMVHGFIVMKSSSNQYDSEKKIFALEDEEGDVNSLIVSNGTDCDEFYEILDALYHDNASVGKIFDMAAECRKYDEEASRNYADCCFVRDAKNFSIGKSHPGETSLFEIPLVYYNSLPKAKLDSNEVATMVDAVISVLEQEINRFEKVDDRKPLLAYRLQEQFELFVRNFKNDEYDEKYGLRKNSAVQENDVVRVTLKKITKRIKELDVHDSAKRTADLKQLIK